MDGDLDGSVARIDDPKGSQNPVIAGETAAPVEAPPSSPETLPDPVPVTPTPAGTGDPDAGQPPKTAATPFSNKKS